MKKRPIIYFSLIEWDFLWSRPQQLMSRLARDRTVLFVEVHGVRNLLADFHFPGDITRIIRTLFRWLRAFFSGARRVSDSLWVLAPIIPPATGMTIVSRTGRLFLRKTLRHWQKRLGIENPVLLYTIPRPELLALIGELGEYAVVYDCMDDYADFPSTHPDFPHWEEVLLKNVDAVSVSSLALQEKKERPGKRPILIPNGADIDHFRTAYSRSFPEPMVLEHRKHPRILYFGVINDWFDTELLKYCIEQRPEWTFIIMGIDVIGLSARFHYANLVFPGRRPYDELPTWLAHSDACIIPFRLTPLTIATNPIKLFEYCASGKVVVSTPLPEVMQYSHVVSIADTPRRFLAALDAEIARDNVSLRERRIAFAGDHSWDERARRLEEMIEEIHR